MSTTLSNLFGTNKSTKVHIHGTNTNTNVPQGPNTSVPQTNPQGSFQFNTQHSQGPNTSNIFHMQSNTYTPTQNFTSKIPTHTTHIPQIQIPNITQTLTPHINTNIPSIQHIGLQSTKIGPYQNTVVNIVDTTVTPYDVLANQMLALQKKMETMTLSNKKTYSIQELCPYSFDRTLYMPPFPPNYVMPTLPKYKGRGNPIEHVR